MLTQREVRRLFDYDPDTGELRWKVSLGTRAVAGSKPGYQSSHGYLVVMINQRGYRAHRLIWLWVHGYFPEHVIDHINRNPSDNRLENLREVSLSCNMRNAKQFSNNTSGVTGVHWFKRERKWYTQIRINNKKHHLGLHQDFTEAVLTRLAAEQCLNWEGCDSSSDAYQYYLMEIRK